MKALLSICFFVGLLSPGAPLDCYQCMGANCARPGIQECDAHEEACISSVIETTLVTSLMPEYNLSRKQCAPASLCLESYLSASTLDGGNFRSNFQCCYTDLCNDMPLSLPETEDTSPNGVECPACFAVSSTKCLGDETINCTGGETKCIEAAAHISIDFFGETFNVAFQGCATPNACFIPLPKKNETYEVSFFITERRCIQESSGKTGASKSLSSLESTIPGQGAGSWGSRD